MSTKHLQYINQNLTLQFEFIDSVLEHLRHAAEQFRCQRLFLLILRLALCVVLVRVARNIMHIDANFTFGELPTPLASIVRSRSLVYPGLPNVAVVTFNAFVFF